MKTLSLLLLLAPAAAALPLHGTHDAARAQAKLTHEAEALVAAVEARPSFPPQEVLHAFDDPRRRTIDFLPLQMRQDQRGLRLGAMTLEQRRHTHALLREVLSEEGYLRFVAIRSLEDVLRARATGPVSLRDPEAYTVQLFGRPSLEAPWAFKLEGHHLSVNATLVDGRFRGTPLFLGANPAEVRAGPDAGLRVLGPQESLARALLASLSAEQRAEALEPEFLPGAVIPVGPLRELSPPAGLSAARMTPAQRELLVGLVASFAANLRADFAAEELERLEQAGIEQLRFLWRGATEPGEEFSYLVVGPTVALQLDAIDDSPGSGANHLHSLWRDPERDFGADLLLRHYAEDHEERR
jgi:hypothetical protein